MKALAIRDRDLLLKYPHILKAIENAPANPDTFFSKHQIRGIE
jgi:hypothetical protein